MTNDKLYWSKILLFLLLIPHSQKLNYNSLIYKVQVQCAVYKVYQSFEPQARSICFQKCYERSERIELEHGCSNY